MNIIAVNPFRCRVWDLHPRADENLTPESCRHEIESFEKHGQLMPVLGRRLRGGRDHDIEIIYGARRLFVARHLNRQLLVEVRDICDRDAIITMDLENRLRKDISAYERGTSYARWLQEGYFSSQHEVARLLRISSSQVSRLLKLARLPSDIVEAFGNPVDICEGWGAQLANLLEDPDRQPRMLQAARNIAAVAPRPPLREIYKQLCAAGKANRDAQAVVRIIKGRDGEELFRVRRQHSSIVMTVSLDILCAESLQAIERSIARVVDSKIGGNLAATRTFDGAGEMEVEEEVAG